MGGAASAYAFWALWRFTHVPLLLLVAVWAIVFDETHGFATISRTYFDAEERARRGRWLWGSIVLFAVDRCSSCSTWATGWNLATELWGYYHIFKQHYGFMMMFKKKNRDFGPSTCGLIRWPSLSLSLPIPDFALHSRERRNCYLSLIPIGSAPFTSTRC